MYQVLCDDKLVYDPRIDELKIFNASITQEQNKIGSFSFVIYPTNPAIMLLQKLKSVITVTQMGRIIFRGRILNDIEGFKNQLSISCESDLAFLLDSVQRPFEFTGTPAELFIRLITLHNEQVDPYKQFKVGRITVEDPNNYINRSDSEYTDTLSLINSQLIGTLGGYLNIRYEADGVYIDYLADLDTVNSQTIELTKNMINLNRTRKGEDIATVIVPLGAIIEDQPEEGETQPQKRLTIESVNGGKDYIEDAEAIAHYGRIVKTVVFDDVTVADNLLKKARDYLATIINLVVSIELTAVDLAGLDKKIEAFRIGSYVKVVSKRHNLNDHYLVKKLTIDLFKPSNNKLTLGTTYMTFTESQVSNQNNYQGMINTVNKIENAYNTNMTNIENMVYSMINQASDEIVLSVGESFFSKDDAETLIAEIGTQFTQTKESFEFSFNEFNKTLSDVNDSSNAQFSEIQKYIRFEDGNIILGDSGTELTLRIENDRISFIENFKEVAYFSNNKFYVTDGEFIKSLRVGKYAFIPRENGNLSFKKVV